MKKLILVLALGLVLGMSVFAYAEPALLAILTSEYGAGNFTEVPSALDQVWYSFGNITSYAEAKWAGWNQQFGYLDGTGFHALMPVVTGNGDLNGLPTATFPPALGPIRLADSALNGTLLLSSRVSDNSDGYDHMWSYKITGGTYTGDYVVGFEDTMGGGDQDHNDFVVRFHGMAPVPEPSSMLLLGMGILGLFGLRRKA